MKIWQCKIGESVSVPNGADAPMREAVARAYKELTGEEPTFVFSGWGAELTEPERAVVEDRLPVLQPNEPVKWEDAQRIADLPEVDELLSGFADDPTGDAGTMIVLAVMQAVGQSAASAEAPVYKDEDDFNRNASTAELEAWQRGWNDCRAQDAASAAPASVSSPGQSDEAFNRWYPDGVAPTPPAVEQPISDVLSDVVTQGIGIMRIDPTDIYQSSAKQRSMQAAIDAARKEQP